MLRRPMLVLACALLFISAFGGCLNCSECSVDEDCPEGEVCSAGVCVECEADADCDTGETCVDGACEAGGGSVAQALCCGGGIQGFDCPNEEAVVQCEGGDPNGAACTRNAERDGECAP